MPAKNTNNAESGFSLESWLGAASRPERTVVIYGDNATQSEIARLQGERDEVEDRADAAQRSRASWGDPEGDDGAAATRKQLEDIDKRIDAAQKRLAKSGVAFTVRAIDSDELDAINRRFPVPKGAEKDVEDEISVKRMETRLSEQIVAPQKFTVEELEKVRRAVGEPEFSKLVSAMFEVNSETAVSSPFWRVNSGTTRR